MRELLLDGLTEGVLLPELLLLWVEHCVGSAEGVAEREEPWEAEPVALLLWDSEADTVLLLYS